MYSEKPCQTAGTFTTNVVKAAPVKWDKYVVDIMQLLPRPLYATAALQTPVQGKRDTAIVKKPPWQQQRR